jgi:hypothetical protein
MAATLGALQGDQEHRWEAGSQGCRHRRLSLDDLKAVDLLAEQQPLAASETAKIL